MNWTLPGLLTVFFACMISLSSQEARADVTWSSGTQSPADYTSSGIVTVTGNVSLNAGTYTFATLIINSGATLTLLSNTGAGTGVIINATTVTVTGTMSADGTGYPSMTGPGAGTGNLTTNAGGAGHGGAGGKGQSASSTGGTTYGAVMQPVTLGSGGGKTTNASGLGGAGGGAIKLVVSGTLTVNGAISANGADGTSGYGAGGGSGGSIWLNAGTFAGAGAVRANGGTFGSGSGGGGGGGRIAIIYGTKTYTGTTLVNGGTGYVNGSSGTAMFADTSNNVFCITAQTISVAASELPSPLGGLTVQNSCVLTVTSDITPGGNVIVSGSGSKLILSANMTSTTGSIDVNTSGTINVVGDTVTGYGYTISGTNISIDSTSTINANGLGYPATSGPGAGGSSTWGGGGGYGGAGGAGNTSGATAGASYGTVTNPTLIGSGGGNQSSNVAGAGGGAIKIIATGTLTVSGTLAANGTAPSGGYSAGGGSGGSLWIVAGTLAGAGSITANGGSSGSGSGGGGGGGRIFGTYSSSLTFSGTWSASGALGFVNGANGSVLIYNTTNKNILCSASGAVNTVTSGELPSSIGDITVQNSCSLTIPGGIAGGNITANTAGVLLVQGFVNMSGSISVTGSGTKVQIAGDIIAPSGNINITSAGQLQAVGNTVTGLGATIAAVNITIDSTSSLNADGLGYPSMTGPGAGVTATGNGGGGGYGGAGGKGLTSGSFGGGTYGSALQPTDLGSGGGIAAAGLGGAGGGAMKIIVSNTLSIAGALSANGGDGTSGYSAGGGSGGSIWIDTNVLSGAGTIRANGGSYGSGSGGAGGGGRIYYAYTTNSFTGTVTANKGTGYSTFGANGTINSAVVGAATKLIFATQPSPAVRKSEDFPVQPVVTAVDASNNTVTTYATAMTLAAYTDASCTTAAGGTFTVGGSTMGFGTTWFSGVKYGTAMQTIYLKATSGSLTSACSSAVAVGGGPATQLVITTQPSTTATAGTTFAQIPVVQARDASGNTDYLYSSTLTAVTYSNSGCSTLDVGGTLTAPGSWSLGTYTYSDTSYTKAGTVYIGWATGSFTACSNSIVVSPAAASYLLFSTEPSSTATAGVDFAQQPVVKAYDLYGNVATSYSTAITLTPFGNAVCTSAGTGTLSGGSSATTSSGVAPFSGVNYTKSGNLYLKATSGSLTTDCSSVVSVSAGPAAQLAFTTQPASNGVIGVNLKTQPVVTAQDAYGNTATSYSTAVTITPATNNTCATAGGGTLNGSATTTSGVASFSNVRYSVAGTFYIKASSGALTPGCSNAVALIPYVPIMFRGY